MTRLPSFWSSKIFCWLVVLTCFNHLEKYEFVNGKDDIPYIMEYYGKLKTCSKPPTSLPCGNALTTASHTLTPRRLALVSSKQAGDEHHRLEMCLKMGCIPHKWYVKNEKWWSTTWYATCDIHIYIYIYTHVIFIYFMYFFVCHGQNMGFHGFKIMFYGRPFHPGNPGQKSGVDPQSVPALFAPGGGWWGERLVSV